MTDIRLKKRKQHQNAGENDDAVLIEQMAGDIKRPKKGGKNKQKHSPESGTKKPSAKHPTVTIHVNEGKHDEQTGIKINPGFPEALIGTAPVNEGPGPITSPVFPPVEPGYLPTDIIPGRFNIKASSPAAKFVSQSFQPLSDAQDKDFIAAVNDWKMSELIMESLEGIPATSAKFQVEGASPSDFFPLFQKFEKFVVDDLGYDPDQMHIGSRVRMNTFGKFISKYHLAIRALS